LHLGSLLPQAEAVLPATGEANSSVPICVSGYVVVRSSMGNEGNGGNTSALEG